MENSVETVLNPFDVLLAALHVFVFYRVVVLWGCVAFKVI